MTYETQSIGIAMVLVGFFYALFALFSGSTMDVAVGLFVALFPIAWIVYRRRSWSKNTVQEQMSND